MNNKITALIPTFQRPQFLQRAIRSVLNQTHQNLQVSVFDNASNDGTREMVQAMQQQDGRIFYHCHKANMGALKNFKYAFGTINTPYFSILSDDDALIDDFYENAIQILEKHEDIMFVIFNTLLIDENSNLIGNRTSTNSLTIFRNDERFNATSIANLPSTWTSMLFRKEVATIYTKMQDQFDIAADMKFLMLARTKYHFAYYSKVGAFFTYHSNTASTQRPYFDLMHHAVQISRYIEIYYDSSISQLAKEQAYLTVKNMLSPSIKNNFDACSTSIKQAIKKICNHPNLEKKVIDDEITCAKRAGFNITAFILNQIYKNKIVNYFVRMFFSRYYEKHKAHHAVKMTVLQNTAYKKMFEKLKALTA